MRRIHVLTGPLTVALAGAAVLAATTSADAAVGKPTVGECRTITSGEAAARTNTTGPVACTKAHDDRVIAVPHLPKGVS